MSEAPAEAELWRQLGHPSFRDWRLDAQTGTTTVSAELVPGAKVVRIDAALSTPPLWRAQGSHR